MTETAARAIRPSLDPGLMLTLALTLFTFLPLALKAGLPNRAEVSVHIMRAEAMQSEAVFSFDWADALNVAGGASQSTFDGSLTYILTSGLHRVFGLGAQDALRALVVLCFLMCSGGMYMFCRRRSGRLGALLAGLVYVYSPAIIYTLPYALAAYPAMLALSLFPLLLWRAEALRDKPTAFNFLSAFLVQVALFNTNALTAFLLMTLACGWIGFETLVQAVNREASQMRGKPGLLALLALMLGAFAAATGWWDAVSGTTLLQEGVVNGARRASSGFQVLRLETLLAPPPLADAGALNGLREARSLGVASWILALAGGVSALVIYIRGYRSRHPQTFLGALYFALMALALMAMMAGALGSPLRNPGLYLVLIAACLAVMASMNGIWLAALERRFQLSAIALSVALPIVTAIPLFYVPEWPVETLEASRQFDTVVPPKTSGDVAAVVSALSIGMAFATAWSVRRSHFTPRPYWTVEPLRRTAVLGAALGGVVALLCLLITFREGVAWISSPPGTALPARVKRDIALDNGVKLLGYDLNGEFFRPGDIVQLSAYWHTFESPAVDYSSVVLLSYEGKPVASLTKEQPGGRASSRWSAEGYVVDNYALRLPADLVPGAYELSIGLLNCEDSDCRDAVSGEDFIERFHASGDSVAISAILVVSD